MGREGARADDGVVAPVVAVPARPGRQTGGDHRAVDMGRELLGAREQGVAVDDQRQGLDDAGVGIGLHGGGESDDAGAGHQAVGVEHEHVVVGAAPAGHEIGDVAGLALEVLGAVPVIDPRQRPELVAQGDERPLLGDPGIRVRGIGQDEIIEMRAEPGRLDGFADRLERREGAGRRLVVDRHDDSGARRQPVRDRRRAGGALDEHEEAENGAREGESDPREVDREQAEQDPLQDGDGADRHDLIHLEGAVGRQGRRAAEHEQPREPRDRLPLGGEQPPLVASRPAFQRLRRHGEPAFRRRCRLRRGERRQPALDRLQGVQR